MKKRTVALLMALMVVFGAAVGGTIAYLTSTATVTNTFTAGDVEIDLNESDTDVDGNTKENAYHLIPGTTYTKDPYITVEPDSESSWVFVRVENGLNDAVLFDGVTLDEAMTNKSWTLVPGETNVWYRENVAGGTTLETFDKITVKADTDNATLAENDLQKIIVTAYAVQKENLTSVADAWAVFNPVADGE